MSNKQQSSTRATTSTDKNKSPKNFLIIPAEGDSPETETWYVERLEQYYHPQNIKIIGHSPSRNVDQGIRVNVRNFFQTMRRVDGYKPKRFEIHAQGGLGAAVAYRIAAQYPHRVERIFFIGGAPAEAMTPIAKIFHRQLSRLWFYSRIPFFADDPNPHRDPTIALIKASSTATMRADPRLYMEQLRYIGAWNPDPLWQMPKGKGFFVPNGATVRPKWWDNTYNNEKAKRVWARYGVAHIAQPGDNFSFYSLMPAEALFEVMDQARQDQQHQQHRRYQQ